MIQYVLSQLEFWLICVIAGFSDVALSIFVVILSAERTLSKVSIQSNGGVYCMVE